MREKKSCAQNTRGFFSPSAAYFLEREEEEEEKEERQVLVSLETKYIFHQRITKETFNGKICLRSTRKAQGGGK